ncbi:MAG: universal stress protein [Candidatus Eremiobacteraeota bacterium]|nr:universal stress protein [Candidatus Eremiobacteraeota bacterium]
MSLEAEPHLIGVVLALCVLAAITATLYWMLHPPTTKAEQAAREAQTELAEMLGSVIIIFSKEIHSEHMTALAVRIARRERAQLLAAYIIEVPLTLPLRAQMEEEERYALGVLATAEAIARQKGVEITTETIKARQVSQGALDLAKRHDAHMIVLGSYREGKYSGAPLGRAIENISAAAECDVLIGVQGRKAVVQQPARVAPEQISY